MKKVLSIFFLINLFFLGCLNEVGPEFGQLRLRTGWPESLGNQLLNEIEYLNVLIEPGNIAYIYDSLDSQIEIDCELGIYNIDVKAIGDSDQVLFTADTGKILVEPFKAKDLLMTMNPAFPHLPPEFVALEKTNLTNSGQYHIQWHPANKATQYDLIESTDSLFSDYILCYSGADTVTEFSKSTQKSYYYKVRAENEIAGSPWSDWIVMTFETDPLKILTDTLPTGKIKELYETLIIAEGGIAPYSYKLAGGNLPLGLTINNETGLISGMPENISTSMFKIEVADNGDPQQTASKEFIISVDPADLMITTTTLADGKVNDTYSQTLSASGGLKPYTWSISNGSLPDGLTLDNDTGEISGTPTTAGTSTFTIQVMDHDDPGQTASKEFTITIDPDDLTITTTILADGKVKDTYSQTLSASGGTEPYTWSISNGSLPEGLSLDSESGEISGTPTIAGTSTFTIRVADNGDPQMANNKVFILEINPEDLIITTNSLKDGKVNEEYSHLLIATGGTMPYTWIRKLGYPPEGLSLNTETGEIYGTPTMIGKSNFTIMVSDAGDPEQTHQKRFSLIIKPGDLVITSSDLPTGEVGIDYSQTLSATGGTAPITWSFTSGNFPDGLTLDAETGEISGTPTSAGTSTFTIQVADNGDPQQIDSKEFTISVEIADLIITTNELSGGKVNQSYSQTLTATGGITPYHWLISSGDLPAGLSLNNESGKISGSPTSVGTSTFTIEVTGSNDPPKSDSKEFTIIIDPADLTITTNSLPRGEVGNNYSQFIAVSGGTSPYSWSVKNGSLPGGLSLDENTGEISGKPTIDGSSTFTIRVADNGDPQQIDDQQFIITIEKAALSISTNSLADGKVGDAYSQTLSASGGLTPYTWSISSGGLPDGLTLDTETGEISGTPTTAGTSTFTIQVMDHDDPGQTDSKEFTITIESAELSITTMSLPDGKAGENYSYQIQATGGITPYTWAELSRNNIPEGMTLDADGTLSGNPNNQPQEGTIEVQVSDSDSPVQTDTKTLSLTIEAGDLELFSTYLPDGDVDIDYWGTINYRYGTAPLITPYTITGDIPDGIILDYGNQGYQMTLSGTPIEGGTFNFTITVKDSGSPQQTRTDSFTITINP